MNPNWYYILKLIDHPSDKVKAAAIRDVFNFKEEETLAKIKQLALNCDDDEVIYEAMEYLLLHTSGIEDDVYLGYLENKKPQIKRIALLCLGKASRYNHELADKFELKKRITNQIAFLKNNKEPNSQEEIAELLLTIGFSGIKEYYPFIKEHFTNKDPLMVISAIKSAGYSRDENFIDSIMGFMNTEKFHPHAVKALQDFGEEIVQILFKKDEDQEFSTEARGFIPEVVVSFKTRQSIVVLLRLLNSKDVLVCLNASKSLKKIENAKFKIKISDKKLSEIFFSECQYFRKTLSALNSLDKALINAKNKPVSSEEIDARNNLYSFLQKQLNDCLETIFNILGIKYLDADMEIAYSGIVARKEESIINTVEFLSNILQSDLKKEFLPLLEYHFLSESESGIKIETYSETKCLLIIIGDRGVVTKLLVLKLIRFLDKESYVKKMNELSRHKNKAIRDLAIDVLGS